MIIHCTKTDIAIRNFEAKFHEGKEENLALGTKTGRENQVFKT